MALVSVYADPFTYANGNLEGKGSWVKHNTSSGAGFAIASNQLTLGTTGTRRSQQVNETYANEQWAKINVNPGTGVALNVGLSLCNQAPSTSENLYRFVLTNGGGTLIYSISKYVAGTNTVLVDSGTVSLPTVPYELRARREADGRLYLDIDGVNLINTATPDTSFSSGQAGVFGLNGGEPAGWTFDDFDSGNITSGDPAINPTGTDVTAYPGQSRTATMANVVATPTAIAYVYNDTIVSTHSDFVWTAGDDGAGTITYTVAQGNLPYGNTDLVIRVSFDSGDPVTLDGMELTVEPDYQYVVAAGTLVTETEESIWSGYEGDTPVAGYQTHTPTETSDARTITVNADGTWVVGAGDGSSPDGYSFPVRVWDGTDWDSYTVTVDLSGEEPGTPTIETVGTVRIGGTIAVTVSGFGDTVNAGSLDGVALTSASDTSITIPALITTATAPRPGTRTLTLTDGADSDSADVLVRAPSGWSCYTITAEFAEAINGVASAFLPDGAAADDFILYPSTKNNVSDSGIGTSYVGTQEFFLLDNTTKIATAFDITTGAGASGFGGTASGTNKMHAVKMTARKMGN